MRKYQYIFLSFALLLFNSCKKPAPTKQIVSSGTPALVEIGGQKFSPAEFKDSYEKNKFASDSSQALTPAEYLVLYTDQKLKVLNAKSEGRDTVTDFREEIKSYHEQLAKNFLVDKAMVEKLAIEAYNRLKQEVKASHILIAVPEDASPSDTLEAYNAAVTLRGRLEEGADFEEMASRFSKDKTAKSNRGNLGYFTAFQMLYPFENAAYNLPTGKISQPVRTRHGYHLIKVTDKRANRGLVQIAHIMIASDTADSPSKKDLARTKILEAYQKIQNGDTWESVVSAYSDDTQSKRNQGILPIFGIGQMVPEIEEAAFSLPKVNAYSKPLKTIYGWHIIKLIEKRGLETYQNMAGSLRQKVVTDSRGKVLEQAHAKRLTDQLKPIEYPEQWNKLLPLADSTLLTGKWDYMKPVSTDWAGINLFSINSKPYDALAFLNDVKRRQQPRPKGSSPTVVFKRYYNEYLTDRLKAYEKEHLEETSPEFKTLMNEIREGVLLSQVMEEKVWQRSLSDSSGQMAQYQKNPSKYRFPERALATVIAAPDTQTLNAIQKTLAQAPYKLERKSAELLFPEGKADITPEHNEALFDLNIIMDKNPDYLVEVAGYRSAQEPETTSSARIRNVIKYLITKNIPLERIIEKDYGSFRPSGEAQRNRRISFQFFSQSKKDVEKVYNSFNPGTVTIQDGYFSQSNPLLKGAKWEPGVQILKDENAALRSIEIQKIEPARNKKFSEARGSVINDYQKELEKQWLSKLKEQFPVKVNQEELEKIKP
ncbi:Chaperone SurA [Dyadobacter sp. CECT 9275]|uniref:Chaperone SurA n=1 Tax=Dyadobacter helix TaxID=2822344 RepID=A0A916J9K1_9BACT|nr:peptidylprolyl isomerase [Dyadobacter sp. CECT 9275]CAG4993074.1 Chaperone SurA [Dyadobacter sp. CECT 9275]